MNLQNQTLTNVFSKALIANSNAPRYARATFAELVSATMLSKGFQHAIKAAENLFGLVAEDKVIKRKLKHAKKAKVAKRSVKRHAKTSNAEVDPSAPKPKRGRPKGSKNKPKIAGIEPAQSMPLLIENEEGTELTENIITEV